MTLEVIVRLAAIMFRQHERAGTGGKGGGRGRRCQPKRGQAEDIDGEQPCDEWLDDQLYGNKKADSFYAVAFNPARLGEKSPSVTSAQGEAAPPSIFRKVSAGAGMERAEKGSGRHQERERPARDCGSGSAALSR